MACSGNIYMEVTNMGTITCKLKHVSFKAFIDVTVQKRPLINSHF